MKKYNDDYFSVIDKITGQKLLDCGDEADALAMVALDPQNRTYTRNKFLMGPVVDVETPKVLPTSNVVESKWDDPILDDIDPWNLRGRLPMQPVKKLPKGEGEPVII